MVATKKCVYIGGMKFSTIKSLEDETRDLMNRNMNKKLVPNSGDELFVYDLVKNHPRLDEKFEYGLDGFQVGKSKDYGHYSDSPILLIKPLVSDDLIDISWKKCCKYAFSNYDPEVDKRVAIIEALRHEVMDQLNDFRLKHLEDHEGKYISALTGFEIIGSAHVDHNNPSFQTLVNDWFNTINYEELELVDRETPGPFGIKEPYKSEWKRFHRKHANLQIVSELENLSILPQVRGY